MFSIYSIGQKQEISTMTNNDFKNAVQKALEITADKYVKEIEMIERLDGADIEDIEDICHGINYRPGTISEDVKAFLLDHGVIEAVDATHFKPSEDWEQALYNCLDYVVGYTMTARCESHDTYCIDCTAHTAGATIDGQTTGVFVESLQCWFGDRFVLTVQCGSQKAVRYLGDYHDFLYNRLTGQC